MNELELEYFYKNIPLVESKGIKTAYIKINKCTIIPLRYHITFIDNINGIKKNDVGVSSINGLIGFFSLTFYVSKNIYNQLFFYENEIVLRHCNPLSNKIYFEYRYKYCELNLYIQERGSQLRFRLIPS